MHTNNTDILANGVYWFYDWWYVIDQVAPSVLAIGKPIYHQTNWSYLIEGTKAHCCSTPGPACATLFRWRNH
jgi:hypothetical protein